MTWTAPIDAYCERTDPSFWAEPFNAISNASFLIAAALLLVRLGRDGWRDRPAILLALWVGVIGVGSFLFHTFANRWSLYADVIPIQVFIVGYFLLAMRRYLGFGLLAGGVLTAAFFFLAARLPILLPFGIKASGGYVGGLGALVVVGFLVLARTGRSSAKPGLSGVAARATGLGLLAAAAVFAVSLTFRTLDMDACAYIATGTHPLWHLLNGLVLYMLVEIARRSPPIRSGGPIQA
jgi:hypothetical protein